MNNPPPDSRVRGNDGNRRRWCRPADRGGPAPNCRLSRPAYFLITKPLGLLTLCALLTSCASLGYLTQASVGHLSLMADREPIEAIVADPATEPELAQRLAHLQAARAFASEHLQLPDNDSYRTYVALNEPFVVYNVFAAPELSLEPETWCFPFAGCVPYRGYYQQQDAQQFAQRLQKDGLDVAVLGAAAYSTLGKFADPVYSSMLQYDDATLAGLLFHELAHQVVYVPGDAAFNESFATVVQSEGVRVWLARRPHIASFEDWQREAKRQQVVEDMLFEAREDLATLYAGTASADEKRRGKAQRFAQLQQGYADFSQGQGGWDSFDAFMSLDLNNAHLAQVAIYNRWEKSFHALFLRVEQDWARFYREVETLAKLPTDQRHARLESLATRELSLSDLWMPES